MERTSQALNFLTKEQILQLNRELISRYGGKFSEPDNLCNSGSLDWVLEAIQYPVFDVDNYPTIAHKAAILNWIINEGHVFVDGNKRTSNMATILFLTINGYKLNATNDELILVSEKIATCKTCNYSFEEYLRWVEERLIETS